MQIAVIRPAMLFLTQMFIIDGSFSTKAIFVSPNLIKKKAVDAIGNNSKYHKTYLLTSS